MSTNRHIHIPLPRLRKLYARYVRLANAGKQDVIEKIARRAKFSVDVLRRRFRDHGLELLNIKPNYATPAAREIRRWHHAYLKGTKIDDLATKYNRSTATIQDAFRSLNLPTRPRGWNGKEPERKTAAEIEALVQSAKRVAVPETLKREWRLWPMERRMDFITRVRARLNSPRDRWTGRFSSNVEPFDYGTPRARAIVEAANVGRTSQNKVMVIMPSSQGVIYGGELYFWVTNLPESQGGIYMKASNGPVRRGPDWRPALHHVIWRETHGDIPASHVVRFRDGNFNNFDPQNLYLQHRRDEAAENISKNPGGRAEILRLARTARWTRYGRRKLNDERAELRLLLGKTKY